MRQIDCEAKCLFPRVEALLFFVSLLGKLSQQTKQNNKREVSMVQGRTCKINTGSH